MPNWCYTNITIYHEDKVKLEDLFKHIQTWSSHTYKPNGFDKFSLGWLGNIIGNSGLAEWKKKADGSEDFEPWISCRGSLQSLYFNNGCINISTETAWSPMLEMWKLLCDKYLPEADIIFTAEEPDNCLYKSNNPDVIGKYCIDVWETPNDFEEAESIWEATEEETREFLQRALKTDETDIKKLINMSSEVIDDAWFSVNEWEKCDISVY